MKFSIVAIAALAMAAAVSAAPLEKRCGKHAAAAAEPAAEASSNSDAASYASDSSSADAKAAKVPIAAAKAAGWNLFSHVPSDCKYVHLVSDGDGCDTVAKNAGIPESQLYSLNPGLHHAGDHMCDNLDTGKAYCVGK
ncbi:hypothetical protein BCR43DRAFT_525052 [Syncephalastrum racemosum]|uniref:LysM domain-containing protein n=1 Tax=Syncephalastrum racemosum TaxID=13706 RepID=A0A1X2H9G3_SYNRA|nr:hypothetical protein BCR43DRAFT_525052 [Syncephalastrum racemosum]